METIVAPPSSLAEILAADAVLLRAGAPAVRVSAVREAGVSLGVGTASGSPIEARAREVGLPTVRRSTGGTGILHLPGDLVWSVVLPRSDPLVGPDFSSAYGRLGAGVVLFLAELGLDGRWGEPEALSDAFCLLGRRGRALSAEGRVLGGAAQHLTASALLHHGVVNRTLDRGLVAQLFDVPPEIATARLSSLTELGVSDPPERLAEGLARTIAASLGGARRR
jgi:lipoate-protein ligase A